MENELEGLAEQVREAYFTLNTATGIQTDWNNGVWLGDAWRTIRAELIRLARENVDLRAVVKRQCGNEIICACGEFAARAERAEAENARLLAANKDCILHFEDCHAELAALRKRIDGPVAEARWAASHDLLCFEASDIGRDTASAMHGKRVRLVEESV